MKLCLFYVMVDFMVDYTACYILFNCCNCIKISSGLKLFVIIVILP